MSATMPSAPRSARRSSTSTTYVAPCSRCAGPKAAPRKLCAIMMWPRTVTLYISNSVTDRIARRRGQLRHDARQLLERALARDQRVEPFVAQRIDRHSHPAFRVAARAMRRRHGADLRRRDRQPPRVKRGAERHGDHMIAVPARFDDRRFEAGDPQRELEA